MIDERYQINNFSDVNKCFAGIQKIITGNSNKNFVVEIKEVKRPRNYEFHKKIFSLIKFAYENTNLPTAIHDEIEITQSIGVFRNNLIVSSGFYKVDVVKEDEIRFIPDSLAYDKCSQSKAEEIYSALLDTVARLLAGSGYDRETLEKLSIEWEKYT